MLNLKKKHLVLECFEMSCLLHFLQLLRGLGDVSNESLTVMIYLL